MKDGEGDIVAKVLCPGSENSYRFRDSYLWLVSFNFQSGGDGIAQYASLAFSNDRIAVVSPRIATTKRGIATHCTIRTRVIKQEESSLYIYSNIIIRVKYP